MAAWSGLSKAAIAALLALSAQAAWATEAPPAAKAAPASVEAEIKAVALRAWDIKELRPAEAVAELRARLKTEEEKHGPGAAETAPYIALLAGFLAETKPEEARALSEKVLDIARVQPRAALLVAHAANTIQDALNMVASFRIRDEVLRLSAAAMEAAEGERSVRLAEQVARVGANYMSWVQTADGERAQAGYRLAEKYQRQALEIAEAVLGAEHQTTGTYLHELGVTLGHAERPREAEVLLLRAAIIRLKGGDAKAQIETYRWLARTSSAQDREEEALGYYVDAADIALKAFGAETADTMEALDAVVGTLTRLHRTDRAESLLRSMLKTAEGGALHRDRAESLADFLEREARFEEALAFRERALELSPKDAENGRRLSAALAVANVLQELGRVAEAEVIIRRELQHERIRMGEGMVFSNTGELIQALASNLYRQGRYSEAEAAARYGSENGRNIPELVYGMRTLRANALTELKRFQEAEALFKEELAATERRPGSRDHAVAQSNLAGLMIRQSRWADAEPFARSARAINERVLGPEHPDTLKYVAAHAQVLTRLGRAEEAEVLFKKVEGVVASRRRMADDRVMFRGWYGLFLQKQRRHPEALRLLRSSSAELLESSGSSRDRAAQQQFRDRRVVFRYLVDSAWEASAPQR